MQKKYTRPQLSIFVSLLRCTIAQMHWDGNVDIVLNLELTSGSISTYNSPLFKYAVSQEAGNRAHARHDVGPITCTD